MPTAILEGENEATTVVTPDTASPEAATTNTDENTASTSSGPDTKEQSNPEPAPTLESVIAAALKTETDANANADAAKAEEPAPGDKQDETKPDGSKPEANAESEGDELPDDPTDAEMADLRPKVQKRITKLLSQRNQYRRELEAFKPDAENFRQIRTFMDQNGIADEDAAQLFKFGAHLRSGRFDEALAIAAPFMQVILEATGRAIPNDLRGRVDTGEMTEDAAKLVSRERYARVLSEQKAAQTQGEVQKIRQDAHVQSIQTATADWEATTRANDADFDLKADAMRDFARALVAERGLPKNAEEAVEYAKIAHTKATNFLRAARPAPKATRPAPSSGASQSRAAASPGPTSLQEAIMQGLVAGARG